MRLLAVLLLVAPSAHAAPPPNADPQFRDWFKSLKVPGSSDRGESGLPCCSVADCRMVESRWNGRTQHYEAKVVRDDFINALRNENDDVAGLSKAWIRKWITAYGDLAEIWVEVPEERVNSTYNPTGRPVLCWSPHFSNFNGVLCFIPYQGA